MPDAPDSGDILAALIKDAYSKGFSTNIKIPAGPYECRDGRCRPDNGRPEDVNYRSSRILSDFQGTCPKGTVCLSLAVPFLFISCFFCIFIVYRTIK